MNHNLIYLIKVNNSCFINCDYCFVNREMDFEKKGKLPSTIAPMSLIQEAVDKSLGFTSRLITIVGGEPLMNGVEWMREAFEIIRANEKKTFCPTKLRLYTNGLLLDDEWIELFREFEVQLVVSYDGFGHGQKGSRKAQDLLRKYAKDVFFVSPTVTRANCDTFLDFYKEMEDLGIKRINVQYDVFGSVEDYKEFARTTIEAFDYISTLKKTKTNLFLYNDAKNLAKGNLVSIVGGELFLPGTLNDYVIGHDGSLRNGLCAGEGDYGTYGNIADYDSIYDVIWTDMGRRVQKDYVNAIKAFGEHEKISYLTRGGGYPGDKYGNRPEDAPHYPKLTAALELVRYFDPDF